MNNNYIPVSHAVHYGNIIYFFIPISKELYSLNCKSGQIESLGMVPWGGFNKLENYLSIAKIDNSLYFIPYDSSFMPVYDIESGGFSRIEMPENRDLQGFMGYSVYNEFVFLFNTNLPIILRYDTENKVFVEIKEWYRDIEHSIFDVNDAFFRQQSVIYKDCLYIPFCNANALLLINLSTLDTDIISLGDDNNGYSGICLFEDELWCSPRSGKGYISVYSLKDGSIKKFNIDSPSDIGFVGIIPSNRISLYSSRNITQKGDFDQYMIADGEYAFVNKDYEDETVLSFNRKNNNLSLMNSDGTISEYKLDGEQINSRAFERSKEGALIIEDEFSSLNEWISGLKKY